MKSTILGVTFLLVCASGFPPVIAVELYSTSFESPDFLPGSILEQDEWIAGLGADSGIVSTDLAKNGSQSLAIVGESLEEFFGFHFGSFARELTYDPIGSGTPIVDISANMNLFGDEPPTCGGSIGFSQDLNGEPFVNVLVGVQEENGEYFSYMSNADGVSVTGPQYQFGQWVNVRASYDFENRTVRGYFNDELIGEVPFANDMGDEILFVTTALGSSNPIPEVIAYFDDLSATAVPEPGGVLILGTALGVLLILRRKDHRKPGVAELRCSSDLPNA